MQAGFQRWLQTRAAEHGNSKAAAKAQAAAAELAYVVQAADADWHPAPRDDAWGSTQTPAAGPGAGKAAAKADAGVPRQEKYDLEPYDSDDYDEGIQGSVPKDRQVCWSALTLQCSCQLLHPPAA